MKTISSFVRLIWYRGSNVFCNCCSKHFRAFVYTINKDDIPFFYCPNCNSSASDRLFKYFLTTDTSLFAKNINCQLFVKNNSFYSPLIETESHGKQLDYLIFDAADLCDLSIFSKVYKNSRPGACFVFADKGSEGLDLVRKIKEISQINGLNYTMINPLSNILKSERLLFGLTNPIEVYVFIKPWSI